MAVASYTSLAQWQKDLITEGKMLLGDLDTDSRGMYFSDDQYAIILKYAIDDFNGTQPTTSFALDSFPDSISGVLMFGFLWKAAITRSAKLIERVPVSGYAGPYADRSILHGRWLSFAQELYQEWKKHRNVAKLKFLPKPVGTVDASYNFYGMNASYLPALRALPSYAYARG